MRRVLAVVTLWLGVLGFVQPSIGAGPGSVSVPNPLLLLIRDPLVHRDLQLSDEQRTRVGRITDAVDPHFFPLRSLENEQGAEQLEPLTRHVQGQLQQVLSAEQLGRLDQILLQAQGVQGLLRNDIGDQLQLSFNQRQQIQQAIVGLQRGVESIRQQAQQGKPRDALQQEALRMRADAHAQIEQALTPEQRERWAALRGPVFGLSKLGQQPRFRAPELAGATAWLHSPALELASLRGKVVLVLFCSAQSSPGMLLKCGKYGENFGQRGFAVVAVHSERPADPAQEAELVGKLKQIGGRLPIALDHQQQVARAWGNRSLPGIYLVDRQGYIRAWWSGEPGENEPLLLQKINELLNEQ